MTIAEVKLVSYPFIGFGKILIVDRVLGRVKTESHGARHRIPSRIPKIYHSMEKCGYRARHVTVPITPTCNMNGTSDKEH